MIYGAVVSAQEISLFANGQSNDDGWVHVDTTADKPYGPGRYEATPDGYQLSYSNPDSTRNDGDVVAALWGPGVGDAVFDNGILKSTIQFREDNAGASLGLRTSGSAETGFDLYLFRLYAAESSPGADILRVSPEGGSIVDNIPRNQGIDPQVGETWNVWAEANGDRLSLTAWPEGTDMPSEPQLATWTSGLKSGTPSIIVEAWDQTRVDGQPDVTFGNIRFEPLEPEPFVPSWSAENLRQFDDLASLDRQLDPEMSSDGLTLFWTEWTDNGGLFSQRIWSATRTSVDSPWENSAPLPSEVTRGSAFSPSITADGLDLYFIRQLDNNSDRGEVYVSRRAAVNEPWSAAEPLTGLYSAGPSTPGNPHHPSCPWVDEVSVSDDGNSILFRRDCYNGTVPPSPSTTDWNSEGLYLVTRDDRDSEFGEPVFIRGSFADADISGDGQHIVTYQWETVSSNFLMLSRQEDGSFSTPEPIQGLNDGSLQRGASFGPDGKTLVFSRMVDDQWQLYEVDLELLQVDSLAGDVDLDGDVDTADQTVLVQNWTGALMEGGDKTFQQGDLDGDGDVDSADQTLLVTNWTGAMMASNSLLVPEPSSGLLLVLTLPLLLGNRQRRKIGMSD